MGGLKTVKISLDGGFRVANQIGNSCIIFIFVLLGNINKISYGNRKEQTNGSLRRRRRDGSVMKALAWERTVERVVGCLKRQAQAQLPSEKIGNDDVY